MRRQQRRFSQIKLMSAAAAAVQPCSTVDTSAPSHRMHTRTRTRSVRSHLAHLCGRGRLAGGRSKDGDRARLPRPRDCGDDRKRHGRPPLLLAPDSVALFSEVPSWCSKSWMSGRSPRRSTSFKRQDRRETGFACRVFEHQRAAVLQERLCLAAPK